MNEHILQRTDQELDKLRSRLIKMGTLVQQQMEFIVKSLNDANEKLADIIISNDDKIDKIDIKIDKHCQRIFALHQPVASDLRLVMSALSINDTMELIGDTIVDIARNIKQIADTCFLIKKTKLVEMGKATETMMVKVLDSYIYSNIELAKEALTLFQNIRNLRVENFELLVELIKGDVTHTTTYLYLQDINRNFKFIADLSVNIIHEMIFLVEARISRHQIKIEDDYNENIEIIDIEDNEENNKEEDD